MAMAESDEMVGDNPFEDPSITGMQKSAPLASEAPNTSDGGAPLSSAQPTEADDSNRSYFKAEPSKMPGDGSLPNDWMQMRAANVVGVVLMFITGFLNFIAGADITVAILSLYAMSFGCLLCCFELRLKAITALIVKNFGFMYNPRGRVVFLLCCGFLMFSLESILGWVVGAYLCALVPANVYILLKYPELEKEAIDYKRNGMRAVVRYKAGDGAAAAV